MPTPAEIRVAWAIRSWEAEVENARRLATRVNIVLTVALAFAGAGTKLTADALGDHPAGWLSISLLGGAVCGVLAIFFAFVRVLIKRRVPGRAPAASAHLLPPDDAAETTDDDGAAQKRAFLSTTAAAYELYGRNAEEKARLAVAQQWLIIGAVLTLLFGALYTWNRAPRRADIPSHLRRVGGD